jgi:GNAT superfamily N-acetyltransferase
MTSSHDDLRALAQRLERAEGTANAAFVEARAALDPGIGAIWMEVAGAYAMFDGVGSPLTQVFGAGVFEPFGGAELDAVEAFFDTRGASTALEVSSVAPDALTALLQSRGYVLTERSTVLVRPTTGADASPSASIAVRQIVPHETELWASTAAAGWSSEGPGISDFVEALGRIQARVRGATCFLAESDGVPIAAGAINMATPVALLAGASTIPSARGRGAQRALLGARLAHAAAHGVDLAMIVTQPESGSQRNAERSGFRAVYSRCKWERAHAG